MSKKIFLNDFRILRPKYTGTHLECVQWLAAVHAKAEAVQQGSEFDAPAFERSMERHIRRFGPSAENMATRGYDLEDFLHRDWEKMRLFNLDKNPHGAGMRERMEVFTEITDRALEYFYPEGEQNPPSEMIHVSCTGYVAPSAPQKLIVKRGWQKDIGVIHAYHMGCYASMPAIRMATAFLNSPSNTQLVNPKNHIDIVHTECCGLHLDPSQHSPEQLVVQSLFSDGHIRYSLSEYSPSSSTTTTAPAAKGLEFLGLHEEIIPGSLDSIGWVLGDYGMRIILARDVPEWISKVLRNFVATLFAKNNIDPSEAYKNGIFAVHPGGPRIIDKVAELLELAPEQVAASRAILKAYGNMSSATLPHIWANIVDDENIPSGKLITSLAFGPGLTIYGAIFRKC